jgi:type IV pilus assembly protein PilP
VIIRKSGFPVICSAVLKATVILSFFLLTQAKAQTAVGDSEVGDGTSSSFDSGSMASGPFAGFMDPFPYDPRGRRDPFAQPIDDVPVEQGLSHGPLLPLQKFELGQLRLVGIIWDVRDPKAMLKDPEGRTHVIGPNTKIGTKNGYVAVIREGELVVVETVEQDGRLVSTAQVVKIAK